MMTIDKDIAASISAAVEIGRIEKCVVDRAIEAEASRWYLNEAGEYMTAKIAETERTCLCSSLLEMDFYKQ